MPTTAESVALRQTRRVPPSCLRAPGRRKGEPVRRVGSLQGASPAMQKLFATILRIAPTSATAMIVGESGVGKELVARAIHAGSPRRDAPFIAVNCAAMPENLIEGELFGHERGSFGGATRPHRGCFERADNGTLFLDEIAEMPVDLQVRLLRVLETGRYTRIGGEAELAVDARVIAASNRDLRTAVASGRLREDLMYRLCVIPVVVPPLRERSDDALLLAQTLLDELNREHGTAKAFTDDARASIAAYHWPGNVRELRNVVQRSFVLADGGVDVDLGAALLPGAAQRSDRHDGAAARAGATLGIAVGTRLDEAERALILATLQAVSGSKVRAAQILGISLKTLYNRLHAYGASPTANGDRAQCKPLALVEAA